MHFSEALVDVMNSCILRHGRAIVINIKKMSPVKTTSTFI